MPLEQQQEGHRPPILGGPPTLPEPYNLYSQYLWRGGRTKPDSHLRFFTSLCEEMSDAQKRELKVVEELGLHRRTRWGESEADQEERERQAASGQLLGAAGLAAGYGVHPPGSVRGSVPSWMAHMSRNAAIAYLQGTALRAQDVLKQKEFPVSSGENHKTLCAFAVIFELN